MANNFSFDIVSEVNMQEFDNAVNQALKEIAQRFDFKNSKSSIDFDRTAKKVTIISDDDYKLRVVRELLSGKLAKRGVSPKALDIKIPKKPQGTPSARTLILSWACPGTKQKTL